MAVAWSLPYDTSVNILLTPFGLPILACVLCILLHIAARSMFPKLGLLDFPKRYGLKRAPLPYPTGILAVFVFAICFAMLPDLSGKAWGVLGGVLILAVYSFIDDRRSLPAWLRLSVQLLVAFLIFATGSRIYTITNPLGDFAFGPLISLDTIDIPTVGFGPLPLLSGIFTLLWLGMTINALNWFDGIPGQTSVISFIGFLTIGLLAVSPRVDQSDLALIAFMLAGIALACSLFDLPPPKVVLGDTGAMFFGLMLGVLTIYSGGKVATAFLVLGVPLIDSIIVVVRRILKGKSPLHGNDKDEHLHHRLLAKGWSPQSVILLTAGIGTAFGLTALYLSTTEKFVAALLLFGLMLVLSYYTRPSKA